MIQARKSQLKFYRDVSLYTKTGENHYVLYKPGGVTLNEMRISEDRIPSELYIRNNDKIRGIQEAQRAFNNKLKNYFSAGKTEKVKETLINIVEETLMDPRSGSLEGVTDTVDIIVSEYSKNNNLIKQLLSVSSKDYTTAMHSIDVMAFALGFASYIKMPITEMKVLGISALLHDVGKVKINQKILKEPRILTDKEFQEIQKHPTIGYDIIKKCRFNDRMVSSAALEHHERLDGSGYPRGAKNFSINSQVIGLIDCYEALTNDGRPYRSAMIPIDALRIMNADVLKGKFDRAIFEKIAYSLVEKRRSV